MPELALHRNPRPQLIVLSSVRRLEFNYLDLDGRGCHIVLAHSPHLGRGYTRRPPDRNRFIFDGEIHQDKLILDSLQGVGLSPPRPFRRKAPMPQTTWLALVGIILSICKFELMPIVSSNFSVDKIICGVLFNLTLPPLLLSGPRNADDTRVVACLLGRQC
jgi:hypothetical protein